MWLGLAIVVGVAMFLIKYKVQDVESELNAKRAEIARDRAAIRMAEQEWTYLNDPEQLRRLSAKHLGFGPPAPQNVTDIASLPMRGSAPAAPASAASPAPTKPVGPTIDAEAAPPADLEAPTAFQRPAGLPVLLARLQRLVLPEAVGATTSSARSR
jgi:hypothetical protein